MSSTHVLNGDLVAAPALSPDGRRLAYLKFTDFTTWYDVYVANMDGTGIQQVTRFPLQDGPPTWTPDGARIILTVTHADGMRWNVFSQSPVPNPADLVQLTDLTYGVGGAIACPIISDNHILVDISPQGMLAFACQFGEIDVLSPDGVLSASYRPTFTDRRRWPNVHVPAWSPDGARLAFIETTADSATNYTLVGVAVKIMNADGSHVTTIATGAGSSANSLGGWSGFGNYSLCWMPDGSRLVFGLPESNLVAHLWVVRADGTGLSQLTSAPGVWDRSVSCSL